MKYIIKIVLISIVMSLTACSYFKVRQLDIQQGNLLSEDILKQVQIGMNKEQVAYILGDPMLNTTLNLDRWDYIYTHRKGKNPTERRLVQYFFKNNLLVKVRKEGKFPPKAYMTS